MQDYKTLEHNEYVDQNKSVLSRPDHQSDQRLANALRESRSRGGPADDDVLNRMKSEMEGAGKDIDPYSSLPQT